MESFYGKKTTQKKNEVTVDQEQSKQQEDRIKIAIDAGHQKNPLPNWQVTMKFIALVC